jgi:hypothetical protein
MMMVILHSAVSKGCSPEFRQSYERRGSSVDVRIHLQQVKQLPL